MISKTAGDEVKNFSQIWNESSNIKRVGMVCFVIPAIGFYAISDTIQSLANWTYKKILLPTLYSIERAILKISDKILKLPNSIWSHVIAPIAGMIKKVAIWTYNNFLLPIANAIGYIARVTFDTIPNWIWQHVLVPFGLSIKEAVVWTYKVLSPVAQNLYKTIKNIFDSFGDNIKTISIWTYKKILKPLVTNTINCVSEIFSASKKFICDDILMPLRSHMRGIRQWTNEQILLPFTKFVKEFFNEILPALLTELKSKMRSA